jgi:hypothetical protein
LYPFFSLGIMKSLGMTREIGPPRLMLRPKAKMGEV